MIRSRRAPSPAGARRRPKTPVVALATLAAWALSSCGVPPEQEAVRRDADAVPYELLDQRPAPTTTTTTPSETEQVSLFFVSGDRLIEVERRLPPPVDPITLLRELSDGLSEEEIAAGARTVVVSNDMIRSVGSSRGTATVDLAPTFRSLSGTDQLLALGQIVYTLTGLPGVGRVSFTIEGQPVDIPRADGSLTIDSVAREDYAALLA